jgi:hypothetical protein
MKERNNVITPNTAVLPPSYSTVPVKSHDLGHPNVLNPYVGITTPILQFPMEIKL